MLRRPPKAWVHPSDAWIPPLVPWYDRRYYYPYWEDAVAAWRFDCWLAEQKGWKLPERPFRCGRGGVREPLGQYVCYLGESHYKED